MKTHNLFTGNHSCRLVLLLVSLFIVSCNPNSQDIQINPRNISPNPVSSPATQTPSVTHTFTPFITATQTSSPTITKTPMVTKIPSITTSPSITASPTITLTPTFDFPDVTVQMTAHCRYGSGKAYLHAADLYADYQGQLWNRNYQGTWLWVKFDKINYPCWVATSVVSVEGDIFSVIPYFHPLPKSTLYGPVQEVKTERNGNTVTVRWEEVWMTEDDFRGYLIEAQVCQNGLFIDVAYHTEKTKMEIRDELFCDQQSNGKLYAVEKHGYTDPITIPWP